MSADNGWLLRRNREGRFVIQMYFASADEYPPITDPNAKIFDTTDEAIQWYELYSGYSEYGLTVNIKGYTNR